MRTYSPEDTPKLANLSNSTNYCVHYTWYSRHVFQRQWLTTIHAKILLTAFIVLTFCCMSGLAPTGGRSSTTLWRPSKLAVHSGVIPCYSECVSVCCRKEKVYSSWRMSTNRHHAILSVSILCSAHNDITWSLRGLVLLSEESHYVTASGSTHCTV